ncbi:MAG: hypothetical protein ACRDM9_14455, partial [Gaiellaceae bacterium]
MAAADAVRGRDAGDELEPRAAPDFDDGLRERVRAAALAGRIVYTDDRCAFHTLALPALRETARPGG